MFNSNNFDGLKVGDILPEYKNRCTCAHLILYTNPPKYGGKIGPMCDYCKKGKGIANRNSNKGND